MLKHVACVNLIKQKKAPDTLCLNAVGYSLIIVTVSYCNKKDDCQSLIKNCISHIVNINKKIPTKYNMRFVIYVLQMNLKVSDHHSQKLTTIILNNVRHKTKRYSFTEQPVITV